MEIKQLRQFIAVAEELNFSRAAQRLGIAQPPLSLAIKNIEAELGVRLFERSRRAVELSAPGHAFLLEARRTLAQMEHSIQVARQVDVGRAGTLRIAYVSSAPYAFLPAVLKAFHGSFPDVDFELLESPSQELVRLVENDQIDVGILRPIMDTPRLHLMTAVGQRDRLVAAFPKNHPMARLTSVRLKQLVDQPLVSFSPTRSPSLHQQVLMACRAAGFTPRITQHAMQLQSILSLVSAGLGIALVPSAVQHLRHPEIVFRPLTDRNPWVALELLVVIRDHNPKPAARQFFEVAAGLGAKAVRKPAKAV